MYKQHSPFILSPLKESTYTFFPLKSPSFSHRWTHTAKLTASHLQHRDEGVNTWDRETRGVFPPFPSQQREGSRSRDYLCSQRHTAAEGRRSRPGKESCRGEPASPSRVPVPMRRRTTHGTSPGSRGLTPGASRRHCAEEAAAGNEEGARTCGKPFPAPHGQCEARCEGRQWLRGEREHHEETLTSATAQLRRQQPPRRPLIPAPQPCPPGVTAPSARPFLHLPGRSGPPPSPALRAAGSGNWRLSRQRCSARGAMGRRPPGRAEWAGPYEAVPEQRLLEPKGLPGPARSGLEAVPPLGTALPVQKLWAGP